MQLLNANISCKCVHIYNNMIALFVCPAMEFNVVLVYCTAARVEVGSLIGAVVLSCRLRTRGVSHHHQDETL